MTSNDPFGSSTDEELRRALGSGLAEPDPEAYLRRLGGFLAGLPERDTQWDVLAGWARPGVVGAAMAAAFLLGVALFSNVADRRTPIPVRSAGVPAAAILAPISDDPSPITFAVLEGQ